MTALIAMLGGVRATVFAAVALAALAWGGIQTARIDGWQNKAGEATAKLATANDRIDGFRALLVDVNAESDRQIAEAKARADKGREAAAAARIEADRLAVRLADTRVALEAAKADPTCADQLKVKLCSAIPLL